MSTNEEITQKLDEVVKAYGYEDLSCYLGFRTSKRVPYITDKWGGRDETYMEIHHLEKTLQITLLPDKITIGGFVSVKQTALNFHEITA